MFTKMSLIVLLIAVISMTACAPQAAPPPAATSAPVQAAPRSEPIILRLAIPDGDSVLYAPYVIEFIEQAKTLSDGTITIEPTWQAGDSTDAGYEIGVIQLVKEGKFDLGLAASRSFDSAGITSFEALQAPFLIDNDALAKAVATSDTASRMLENLSSSGLAGLTLWPEDLRHPFSVDPAKPLLSPDAFAGLTIRSTDTGVGDMLIKELGGNPIFEASDYQGAEAGLRQGAHLTGRPAATGNVTFFSKYQTLFANGAAFEQLSDTQRTVLKEAAAAAQKKALAERPSDAEAGAAWCADGGTIVLASDQQVAAFQEASQPIFDKLQENAFNAESIAAISEIKANTPPSPGAQACAPTAAIPSEVSAENQTWSKDLLPNGIWQATLTPDDLFAVGGILESVARENAGVHTFTFRDGEFTWTLQGDSPGSCEGTYTLVEDVVRLNNGANCGDEVDDIQWRLDDAGLHLHLVAIQNAPFAVIKANLEAKPYQKVEEWSQGLPPNGVWTVDLTIEDIIRMGVLESNAPGWAGLNSYEFNDGEGIFRGEFLDGVLIVCPFTYEAIDDFFRVSYGDKSLGNYECGEQEDDLQWRLDEEGLLHFNVLAVHEGLLLENTALYEARPWQLAEEWSQGLPPNGVWQVTLTNDEVINMGLSQANAPEWSGVYSFTFQDGDFHWTWEGTEEYAKGKTASADGSYEVVEDFVRLTSGDIVDDIQWRLDEEGLHFHLLATQNDPFNEIRAMLETRPYQKAADN